MVPSQNGDSLPEADLESDEKSDRLHTVVTSVNIVAHEQVVGVRGLAPNTEQFHEIMELAVNIPTYRHWTFHLLNIAFFAQNLLGFLTECLHLILCQLLALHQLLDPSVQLFQGVLLLRVHVDGDKSWFSSQKVTRKKTFFQYLL